MGKCSNPKPDLVAGASGKILSMNGKFLMGHLDASLLELMLNGLLALDNGVSRGRKMSC